MCNHTSLKFQCQICLNDSEKIIIVSLNCGHLICLECYTKFRKNPKKCPFCRQEVHLPCVLKTKNFCSKCRVNFLRKPDTKIVQLQCGHTFCEHCLYEKEICRHSFCSRCCAFQKTRLLYLI